MNRKDIQHLYNFFGQNSALPQTAIYPHIIQHFHSKSVKKAKLLFIGYDGMRADALYNIIPDVASEYLKPNPFSAIRSISQTGCLKLTYSGGDKIKQATSTAPAWASIFTGKWAFETGLKDMQTLSAEYPTFLRTLSMQGFKTHFAAIWEPHFTHTYKNEIALAKQNGLPIRYTQCQNDEQLLEAAITTYRDYDISCLILEAPDYAGHHFGFGNTSYRYTKSVNDTDTACFRLVEHVFKNAKSDEDWLIVITSDHGGHTRRHGTQKADDRFTFLACNKPLTF